MRCVAALGLTRRSMENMIAILAHAIRCVLTKAFNFFDDPFILVWKKIHKTFSAVIFAVGVDAASAAGSDASHDGNTFIHRRPHPLLG